MQIPVRNIWLLQLYASSLYRGAGASLAKAARLVPDKPRYRALALQLEAAGVTGQAPQLSMVPALQRQRLLARDRLMLAAAELLMTLSIPTTDEGVKMLPLPALDDTYLRKLFEHAAFGLYSHKLTPEGWSVSHGTRQKWQIEDASAGIGSILPGMQLDIVLEAPGVGGPAPRTGEPAPGTGEPAPRRLIIDTRFTSITKPNHYREQALSSTYVYQMYSYLMSQDQPEDEVKSEAHAPPQHRGAHRRRSEDPRSSDSFLHGGSDGGAGGVRGFISDGHLPGWISQPPGIGTSPRRYLCTYPNVFLDDWTELGRAPPSPRSSRVASSTYGPGLCGYLSPAS